MKQLLLIIQLLLVTAFTQAGNKIKVACVGNSVTFGHGITDKEKAYSVIRAQRFSNKAIVPTDRSPNTRMPWRSRPILWSSIWG